MIIVGLIVGAVFVVGFGLRCFFNAKSRLVCQLSLTNNDKYWWFKTVKQRIVDEIWLVDTHCHRHVQIGALFFLTQVEK